MLKLLLIAALICATQSVASAFDTQQPEVKQFVLRMVKDYGFDPNDLNRMMRSAQSQSSIIDAMNRPAEKAKLWYEYRQIFITPKRIRDGTDFWIAHRDELEKAASLTGVAPEFIVAILGVETLYGRQTGHYRVLDALTTLAFDYPPRSQFFLGELEQFLLLTREARIDPMTASGSYAGAMGAPQFMPSSYRRFGMDGSGDGRIDLWTNWLDVFASIGNYFKEHGWQSGEPTLAEAQIEPLQSAGLDARTLILADTVATLKMAGFEFDTTQADERPALIIAFDKPDGRNWRVGYNNFYVITRYNHSTMYAMAASELAAAIKQNLESERLPVLNDVRGASVISALSP